MSPRMSNGSATASVEEEASSWFLKLEPLGSLASRGKLSVEPLISGDNDEARGVRPGRICGAGERLGER